MHASKPDCKHYLAEDLCGALPTRPEEHCCNENEGDCANYVSVDALLANTDRGKDRKPVQQ